MRLIFMMFIFSLQMAQASWNELEEQKEYKINQAIQLIQNERSRSILDISQGEKFLLKEITGLDMIRVTYFQFDYKNCPGPAMTTDMEIIAVKNTSPMVEVGAQLEKDCKLGIFIENKDLMSSSLFE
jgi:hypothetical protein